MLYEQLTWRNKDATEKTIYGTQDELTRYKLPRLLPLYPCTQQFITALPLHSSFATSKTEQPTSPDTGAEQNRACRLH